MSDEQIELLAIKAGFLFHSAAHKQFARAIEAHHGISAGCAKGNESE